jgi:hypothetical protein
MAFLKLFLNAMIRNIKIYNILNIIKNSNLWNLINVLIKKIMEIFIQMFPMIFQILMDLGKSRCDIPRLLLCIEHSPKNIHV